MAKGFPTWDDFIASMDVETERKPDSIPLEDRLLPYTVTKRQHFGLQKNEVLWEKGEYLIPDGGIQ